LRFVEAKYAPTSSISVDCSLCTGYPPPPKIAGHIPDVYAKNLTMESIVIGEAKTCSDLESPRTKEQLTAFINYLEKHQNSVLVLATRWSSINSAKSIVRSIFRHNKIKNVSTHYLDSYQ